MRQPLQPLLAHLRLELDGEVQIATDPVPVADLEVGIIHEIAEASGWSWMRRLSSSRALSQSRCTVRSDTSRNAAISLNEKPQKNLRSTHSASRASILASDSSASFSSSICVDCWSSSGEAC